MTKAAEKLIIVPIDGSEYSRNSIKYICNLFKGHQTIRIILCYILPTLPPLFADPDLQQETARLLKAVEKKNQEMGERILAEGKALFKEKGFADQQVQTVIKPKEAGIAKDICRFAENKDVDAIMLSTRGRSRIESFLMGEVSNSVLEISRTIPVWLINAKDHNKNVLIGIDASDHALRAVDHAGFLLSGTDCTVTLFHTYRNLRRFLPREVLEAGSGSELEKIWYQMAGNEVMPYINKAKQKLTDAGFDETKISTRLVEGSRSAADDILKEARKGRYGTIVLGRRGLTGVKELIMGSVTRKVVSDSRGLSVWVV